MVKNSTCVFSCEPSNTTRHVYRHVQHILLYWIIQHSIYTLFMVLTYRISASLLLLFLLYIRSHSICRHFLFPVIQTRRYSSNQKFKFSWTVVECIVAAKHLFLYNVGFFLRRQRWCLYFTFNGLTWKESILYGEDSCRKKAKQQK